MQQVACDDFDAFEYMYVVMDHGYSRAPCKRSSLAPWGRSVVEMGNAEPEHGIQLKKQKPAFSVSETFLSIHANNGELLIGRDY